MKYFNVYVMATVLLLSLPSIAQKRDIRSDQQNYKRLHIGDTIPMESILFNNVRNYPSGKAKLSDFKGKNLILDFWNKGCSACIAAFPHMNDLQQEFKDEIQILLITENTEEELALLFKNSRNVKETKIPMIIGEQVLTKKLFPNGTVPYHVWINKEGIVKATTTQQETTSKNLKEFIANQPLHLFIKNEFEISDSLYKEIKNEKKSLLKVGSGLLLNNVKYYAQLPLARVPNAPPEPPSTIPELPYYSMFMKGLHDDFIIGTGHFGNLRNENYVGFRVINGTISDFYRFAFGENDQPFEGKILPEGGAKILYEEITDTTNLRRYLINNRYCYESSLQNFTLEGAKTLLKQDLIRFFGMIGKVEERPIKHLILNRLRTSAEKNLWANNQEIVQGDEVVGKSKKGWVFNGGGSLGFISTSILNANRSSEDPVILDETNFNSSEMKKNIDVLLRVESLKATPENIFLIRKELAKYGLGLKEELRNVKVLVLRPAF